MDRITFTVNGVRCHVGSEVSSDVTLLDYLRNYLGLRGTKYMCREGGCGACIVTAVKARDQPAGSVNACLVSVTSCHNWDITTIESLGNKIDGFHAIQRTLADHNGTQCGYCTPGWIMAMYSLTRGQRNPTMLELEKSFASNLCRCTGYRPILEAFKTFSPDAPRRAKSSDIEDLNKCKKKVCGKNSCCNDEDEWCMVVKDDIPNILEINLSDGKFWYRVSTIQDIFDVLQRRGDNSYMLVAGNTAKGVIPIDEYPTVLIDVSGVAELKGSSRDQNLIINAGNTLTELLDILQTASGDEEFAYLSRFHEHVELIGHLGIRNVGTIAGNLMMKHQSLNTGLDIFLLIETVGGLIVVRDSSGEQRISLPDFLTTDMRGKVIVSIVLPPLGSDYRLVTYKIMKRAQNTRGIVNAGFLYRLEGPENIVRSCRIIFSNLASPYTRGTATEQFLIGKNLFTNDTLQSAARILDSEIQVGDHPPEPSGAFKKQLALGLFYKALLSLCPANMLSSRYRSGAIDLSQTRPVSSGQQVFDTNSELWPLNQPLPKIEALKQCAGEVHYTEDMPVFPHEVYASFVLSTVAKGNIVSIDASDALNEPGVIAFYTARDIPGLNSFTPADYAFYSANEEILSSGTIEYYNQPLAIIVAETRHIADKAAKLVHVTYNHIQTPIIDIKAAKDIPSRVTEYLSNDATNRGSDVDRTISGEHTIYGQYHFPMETLVCVTHPSEDGLEVYSATQWMDGTQIMISRALNIDANCIDVSVRRLGGAYGIKISRATQVAVASSLVAWKLHRPCRFIQSLTTNMRAVGKRLPSLSDFQVQVNRNGVIQHVDYQMYLDNGYKINELLYLLGTTVYQNVYDASRWTFKGYNVTTDTYKNTWCRAPGTLEVVSMAEIMLEQIAYEQDVDPVQVRIANVDTTNFNEIIELYNNLEQRSNFTERRAAVERFNTENRWKKRGLRTSFMRWEPMGSQRLQFSISVYHNDGTVAIQHSGIEMGQGINTRAAQIVAYMLKIPLEKVLVKGSNTIVGPNAFITGGDMASTNITIAAQRACNELLERLQPIYDKLPNATWEEIVKNAYDEDINLQGHGFVDFNDTVAYTVYGVAFCEVEVDILTGQHEIIRVDLIEDAGRPINPEIEIGQIEGAFTMALGYWTSENLIFNQTTGELLTDRAWHYFIPQARDIPQDFRVYLRERSFSTEVILGAKATGEAPMCLGVVVSFALREAIAAARIDAGRPRNEWFNVDGPFTLEKIGLNALTTIDHFRYT